MLYPVTSADEKRAVQSVIDIAAIGGPRGFDMAHLAHIGVGKGARIYLNAAWQETACVRRHELVCLILAVPSTAVAHVKPPPAEKRFTLRVAEVDRAQYVRFSRAADARTVAALSKNGGRVLTQVELADILSDVAERYTSNPRSRRLRTIIRHARHGGR